MTLKYYDTNHMTEAFRNLAEDQERYAPSSYLGKHVLGTFFKCENLPDDVDTIRQQMEDAARALGATIVQSVFHRFNPYGLSGVVVIAESHLAIHTWPEYQCACVDLFTCSDALDPRVGFEFLEKAFGAQYSDVMEMPRGVGARPEFEPPAAN